MSGAVLFRAGPMRPNSSIVVIICKPSIRVVYEVFDTVQFHSSARTLLRRRFAGLLADPDSLH